MDKAETEEYHVLKHLRLSREILSVDITRISKIIAKHNDYETFTLDQIEMLSRQVEAMNSYRNELDKLIEDCELGGI